MSVILLSILGCIAVAAGVLFAIRKMAPRPETLPVTADWIEELSMDRYRPMLRLLDESEIRSLQAQPGFTPKMAATFRRQRCQIFRGYLRSLHGDFGRICLALKLLMIHAGEDRPDLASTLVRGQIAFACVMALVQVRVALYSFGIGTVNVSDLLNVFDGLRVELRTLVPANMMSAA